MFLQHAQGIENKRTRELSEDELTQLRDEVEKYTIEGDLRRFNALNIKRLKEIQCYRGKRHIAVRPCTYLLLQCSPTLPLHSVGALGMLFIASCITRVLMHIVQKTCERSTGVLCGPGEGGTPHRMPLSVLALSAHGRGLLRLWLRMQQLPVRGQTTKNNARTRKGKAVAIAGKKK